MISVCSVYHLLYINISLFIFGIVDFLRECLQRTRSTVEVEYYGKCSQKIIYTTIRLQCRNVRDVSCCNIYAFRSEIILSNILTNIRRKFKYVDTR